jgi:7-cyano-7-deazaguanine synthase
MKPIDTHRDQTMSLYNPAPQNVIHVDNANRPVDSVAVVSGGMDSVTLLYLLARAENRHPLVLSFDYGQKHRKELELAAWHADKLGLIHKVVNLTSINDLLDSSALVGGTDVPEGHYADETMKATVVPNRNSMMINIATAAAVNNGAQIVAVGVHAGDHPIYPDCRVEFLESLERTLKIANEGFIRPDFLIYAPFAYMNKQHIAAIGTQLGVSFEKTWSCYKGGDLHCGLCGTCVERREAFELAEVDDPTVYSYESNVQ